jgi:hypothetical protein
MWPPETETAAPTAIGNGGNSKGAACGIYPNFSISANDFATAFIAARCHLPVPTARVVVELAQLGGSAS